MLKTKAGPPRLLPCFVHPGKVCANSWQRQSLSSLLSVHHKEAFEPLAAFSLLASIIEHLLSVDFSLSIVPLPLPLDQEDALLFPSGAVSISHALFPISSHSTASSSSCAPGRGVHPLASTSDRHDIRNVSRGGRRASSCCPPRRQHQRT